MSMNDKQFNDLQTAIDRLESSGLSESQLDDLTTIIRITHKHIHKSNNMVLDANNSAKASIKKLEAMELALMPCVGAVQ